MGVTEEIITVWHFSDLNEELLIHYFNAMRKMS